MKMYGGVEAMIHVGSELRREVSYTFCSFYRRG